MLLPRFAVWISSIGLIIPGANVVYAQEFPNKPIRIVTTAPGGGSDLASRLVAQGLTSSSGRQVIVDNRSGGGIIAAEIVAKAQPDGYTLIVYSGTLWILPLMQKAPYDVTKDFAPITLMTSAPNLLVVHPSVPVKSIKELIALAKSKPGALSYGSSSPGSSTHLATELFKSMADVDILHVPYKTAGQAINDLIGAQVQLMFSVVGSVAPHVKSGRLRSLAVTSAKPTALVPGVPTVASSGLPGYESVSMIAMFAPSATPTPIVNRLNQDTVRVLNSAEVKDKLFGVGVDVVGSSPGELSVAMKSEMARLGKVIQAAGIKAE